MSDPTARKAFGERLRSRRRDLHLKQRQLAAKIGSTPESVSNWELGKSYPVRHSIFKLARALDCDRTWLEGIPGARSPIAHDPEETVSP